MAGLRVDPIYIDNHLLVVDKPPGLLIQGDRTGDQTLFQLSKSYLKERFNKPGNVFLGIVHRLDRPVSGVVLLARTSKAASRLSRQFREKTTEKKYLALVGKKIPESGILEDYIERNGPTSRISDKISGQYARLHYRKIRTCGTHSLVEIMLDTGRHHQIRVQLANLGFPIVGDFRYGSREQFPLRSIALHSSSLKILHPVQKHEMLFSAPLPQTWPDPFRTDSRPD